MKREVTDIIWTAVCMIAYLICFWICAVNVQEIVARIKGQYTLFSQMASLDDGQAVLYLGLWTSAFIILFALSVRRLVKQNYSLAGMGAVNLILLIVLSLIVDRFFYIKVG